MNSARKDHRETVLSILCGKEDWTPDKTTEYRSLAFREDGVGYVSVTIKRYSWSIVLAQSALIVHAVSTQNNNTLVCYCNNITQLLIISNR